MRVHALLFMLLVAGAAAAQAGGMLAVAQERPTLLGAIAKDWQFYTVMAMLLMVGLVAIAYAIATAFSLPDLRAWADVELGEIFASALVLVFIMGIIFFVDEAVRGTVAPSFPAACPSGEEGFCPARIASVYLEGYTESAGEVYRDIMIKNIDKAKEATAGGMTGAQDMIYGYISFRFREKPEEMVIVEMYDQLLQYMGTVLVSLSAQSFLLGFLTMRLAPIAIFLGIILRSFFLTRKLGGLLLAFGLGFLFIFPLTYALAWFTLDATVYGGQRAATGQLNPCPEVCLPFSRIVKYSEGVRSEIVEIEEVREAVYDDCMDSLDEFDESGRSIDCLEEAARERLSCINSCKTAKSSECFSGCEEHCVGEGLERAGACTERCEGYCRGLGVHEPSEMPTEEEMAVWRACMDPCESDNDCAARDAAWSECFHGCSAERGCDRESETIAEECDAECPLAECPVVVVDGEEYCNAEADEKIIKLENRSIIQVGECPGATCKEYGYCEFDPCGFPIPYHQGCTYPSGWRSSYYSVASDVCNTRLFDPDDPAYSEFDESELYGCPEECRVLAPLKNILKPTGDMWGHYPPTGQNDDGCLNRICKEYYKDEEEYCIEALGYTEENVDQCIPYNWPVDWRCKRYGIDCPSQCMWITTSGKTDDDCPETCEKYRPDYEGLSNPQDPLYLWENNLSRKTCMYIIPDVVFEEPERCTACAFVAEKGLTFKPQMIMDCAKFCGAESNLVMAEDPATMTNKVGGLIGPDEVKSVSKLMIPAYVLPLFNLAVTLMFIITLSPMLGGDIDIPGMMRMMV